MVALTFLVGTVTAMIVMSNMFISGSGMRKLKAEYPNEWERIGKPREWWQASHFWWFWYVVLGSYKKVVRDDDNPSWFGINRVLCWLEVIGVLATGTLVALII